MRECFLSQRKARAVSIDGETLPLGGVGCLNKWVALDGMVVRPCGRDLSLHSLDDALTVKKRQGVCFIFTDVSRVTTMMPVVNLPSETHSSSGNMGSEHRRLRLQAHENKRNNQYGLEARSMTTECRSGGRDIPRVVPTVLIEMKHCARRTHMRRSCMLIQRRICHIEGDARRAAASKGKGS